MMNKDAKDINVATKDDDVIYRQDAIDAVEESRRLNHHQDGKEACAHEYEHRHFLKILRDLPSAQPERLKGKWLVDEDGNTECPFCGNICGFGNYCNECGADLRGENDA